MGFRDVIEYSLRNVWELDYPDYELIVVDNAPTDGSFEVVKQCVENIDRLEESLIGRDARMVKNRRRGVVKLNVGDCSEVEM
jgi:cellulose synthase/poly-beta-1,6-N-acetylglucosamine synthase-like glycosyltransferase